jgi:hypothetical protein
MSDGWSPDGMTRTLTLVSGARLDITISPFAIAKKLADAVSMDFERLGIVESMDSFKAITKIGVKGFSSRRIDKALKDVWPRVLYNKKRVTDDTWESLEARGDYIQARMEVVKENVLPFLKPYLAKYSHLLDQARSVLKSQSKTVMTGSSISN